MAQLIKLQDYVSRYETDLYRYPSQFVRLKKQQWDQVKYNWEHPEEDSSTPLETVDVNVTPTKRKWFSIKGKKEQEDEFDSVQPLKVKEEQLNSSIPKNIQTEDELKRYFLSQIFKFQLRWASSTISEKSYIDHSYYVDEKLQYLLQRFPDNILLMYHPILKIKNAPVEFEVIFLTPSTAWCLTFLENEEGSAFIGSQERFWLKKYGQSEVKTLNPMISLNRMEHILKQIFKYEQVELPIKKGIISRNGYINFPQCPYDLNLFDKKSYDKWFQLQRNNTSPIKSMQLKAANALLNFGQITSFTRLNREEPSFDEDQIE